MESVRGSLLDDSLLASPDTDWATAAAVEKPQRPPSLPLDKCALLLLEALVKGLGIVYSVSGILGHSRSVIPLNYV